MSFSQQVVKAHLEFTVVEFKSHPHLVRRYEHILNDMTFMVVVADSITLKTNSKVNADANAKLLPQGQYSEASHARSLTITYRDYARIIKYKHG